MNHEGHVEDWTLCANTLSTETISLMQLAACAWLSRQPLLTFQSVRRSTLLRSDCVTLAAIARGLGLRARIIFEDERGRGTRIIARARREHGGE